MDIEEELPQDVFMEYEEYLKTQLTAGDNKKRAAELIAYLYWHRMDSYAKKAARCARDAVRQAPNEKGCQWILQKAEGHAAWDWNISNHSKAVEFYRELVEAEPGNRLPYLYLLDNLLADHRADEAQQYLDRLNTLKDADSVIVEVYRAHIALARFDAATADNIIEQLVCSHPDDFACLFEAAQYYAKKCDYEKAIAYYEKAFSAQPRQPRFQDELMGIADIYEITGNYKKAAETYDRIIDLLANEWGFTEETGLKHAQKEKARLLEKAQSRA